jgi:tryptophanyl-tRNA synthetase
MSLPMDSRGVQEPKPDADKNMAVQLLKLVAPPDKAADYETRLRAGGFGYGDLKKALFEQYWEYFATARVKRQELERNLDYVEKILRDGAGRAKQVAQITLKRARVASGLE